MPTPTWIKELLGPTPKDEPTTEPVPDTMPGNEYAADVVVDDADAAEDLAGDDGPSEETDLPIDVQDEVRALAAQEAEVLANLPEPDLPEGIVAAETDPEERAPDEDGDDGEDDQEDAPETPPPTPRPPRRFEFDLAARTLRAFVAHLDHLVDEVKVTAQEDELRVVAVDPAHLALVDVRLRDVDGYERRDGAPRRFTEPLVFGVDLVKLQDVLRSAKKDDHLKLLVDLPDANGHDRITVELGSTTRTMAALDTTCMADPRIPALNLPGKLSVSGEDFLGALRACASVSDHVRLIVSYHGLSVLAEGDTDRVALDFRDGSGCEVAYVRGDDGQASSLFPLDYLTDFVKAAKGETLTLELGTDYPIRIAWTGTTQGVFLCAPRVEAPD